MLIINNKRNQNRRTTQKLKYLDSVQEQPRRASCCCDNCGKLTHFQQIYQNSPLVVQQHQVEKQKLSQLIQCKPLKKMISTSFHLSNKNTDSIKKRRHSCKCEECGSETLFQKTSCHQIPLRQPIKSAQFKSFIIKKSLGKAFQEFSDVKKSHPLTSRSHKDIIIKSPLLVNRLKTGSCLLPVQNSHGFKKQVKANKQMVELKGFKNGNSSEKFKLLVDKHEHIFHTTIRLKTIFN
ncbi:unnamed protein product (macronuclear) [Paramecium tetraurelia]|uniref:Uncharacterized protein n=1 Tax=Paramecium tetraurelia TaxID=5888 RepID=A0DLF3_PARTE|nr:uncharacterized protein GSPATT00018187001 [Paramecium tetraurelia]CAK83870.1 unnamed protein product [Paramecium tetraurelia]|eukprot:XP_001451267.1 hypothetical protein (macronuclear) [Paramecium tetraurelia strain d4-2]